MSEAREQMCQDAKALLKAVKTIVKKHGICWITEEKICEVCGPASGEEFQQNMKFLKAFLESQWFTLNEAPFEENLYWATGITE